MLLAYVVDAFKVLQHDVNHTIRNVIEEHGTDFKDKITGLVGGCVDEGVSVGTCFGFSEGNVVGK